MNPVNKLKIFFSDRIRIASLSLSCLKGSFVAHTFVFDLSYELYSYEQYLEETVESTFEQGYQDIKLVLVEDGLNGNLKVLVKNIEKKIANCYLFYNECLGNLRRNYPFFMPYVYKASAVKF